MEHELLQDEPGYNLRLMNKSKKEKEKVDPGERKKWNFRKANTMEVSAKSSPSPTSGLINPSAELTTNGVVSPTMIFENKISDNDIKISEESDLLTHSPPNTINLPPPSSQRKRTTSPKTVTFDHQPTLNRQRLASLPLSTSPPPINIPARTPPDRYQRQLSAPNIIGSPVAPNYLLGAGGNESFTQTILLQTDRPIQSNIPWNSVQQPLFSPDNLSNVIDVSQDESHKQRKMSSEKDRPIQSNIAWNSVQQPLFSPDNLSNVIDVSQDESHKQRKTSEKDTPGVEALDENRKMMWQGDNQPELIQEKWTNFSSTTNEVFVPDNKAWEMAENPAIETDENEQQSAGEASNSSRSSYSSESDNNEETEESVWKINEEQRAYYLNQFRILQPAEKGVIAGPKARDFFLKSGLATDVLSKIWYLSDLDSDGALNFEEFCIAMHIVVAVRHGLDVPTTIPQYLIPEQCEKQVPVVSSQKTETDGQEQLSVPEAPQAWARFSPDPQAEATAEEETTTTLPVHPVDDSKHTKLERTFSEPISPEENKSKNNSNQTPKRKTSVGIPRIRGATKQTNLLDTPHWAILPPPSKFNKDAPDETGNLFVPTGTIIPDDSNIANDSTAKPALLKVEKTDRASSNDSNSDSNSDSSSSETEQTVKYPTERPKSLTKEDLESASLGNLSENSSQSSVGRSLDSVDGGKNHAPLPPPRKKTNHSRSSSLDLQKLFNNKGGNMSLQLTQGNDLNNSEKIKSLPKSVIQNNVTDTSLNKEPSQTSSDSQENFADFSKFEHSPHSNENLSRHRRSASLDSIHAIWVEPTPPLSSQDTQEKDVSSNRPEMLTSVPRPVPKKKPATLHPPLRQKKDPQQDSGGSDGVVVDKEKKLSKEPIHFVVKPLTRLEQLHSKIRDLKSKNTRLSRVNNELQQELKQNMEKRIGLESSLDQLKPFAK